MQLGREPNLRVDDAVGREVLGALTRDARERIGRLHHAHGVGERLEVQHQVLAIRTSTDPGLEIAGIVGRQAPVAGLVGEFHDRGGPQTAVEVVVQEHLGGTPYRLDVHAPCLLDHDGGGNPEPVRGG